MHDISYTNVIMLNAILPSYGDDKEEDSSAVDVPDTGTKKMGFGDFFK